MATVGGAEGEVEVDVAFAGLAEAEGFVEAGEGVGGGVVEGAGGGFYVGADEGEEGGAVAFGLVEGEEEVAGVDAGFFAGFEVGNEGAHALHEGDEVGLLVDGAEEEDVGVGVVLGGAAAGDGKGVFLAAGVEDEGAVDADLEFLALGGGEEEAAGFLDAGEFEAPVGFVGIDADFEGEVVGGDGEGDGCLAGAGGSDVDAGGDGAGDEAGAGGGGVGEGGEGGEEGEEGAFQGAAGGGGWRGAPIQRWRAAARAAGLTGLVR